MFKKNSYSLHKCRKILYSIYKLYKKKSKYLELSQKNRFENILVSLQTSINNNNKNAANRAAQNLEGLADKFLKRSFFEKIFEYFIALAFAIILAFLVRQMWFELYSIPTGSMRPTLKEKDLVVVLKSNFSINVPLQTKHFYFNQDLLKRGSIVVFTSANLDIESPDMLYFYLFPGKKQLVKRLIGKPGDLLYFYGGQIYGIDKNGNTIKEFYKDPWLKNIKHIPFITFQGKTLAPPSEFANSIYSPFIIYQMNEPIAALTLTPMGQIEGELITEDSNVFTKSAKIKKYSDIWGFKNFAMTRILTKKEVQDFSAASLNDLEDAFYYLELTHHPNIKNAKIIRDDFGRSKPVLSYNTSLIPLDEKTLKIVFNNMSTARFCVKNGFLYRYGSRITNNSPQLKDIPNGCYEIQDGIAYKVNFLGYIQKLDKNHPLNSFSKEKTQFFYNLGIELSTFFEPQRKNQSLTPSRYAYFKQKNLYLMDKLIFKKTDPFLISFLQREYQKQLTETDYVSFEDLGPPLDKNKEINKSLLQNYGLQVPDNMYLVLGDNYALSADSRDFGFVPQDNLKGGVNLIFWPPSNRWGLAFQPQFKFFSLPNIIVTSIVIATTALSIIIFRRKLKKPLKF